ncbi:hypothetical protein J5N97_029145 [Dioscorea zingiberensis]|uniref:Uncharacterized protein n=1 Tax=Dioscorea zingiberensis TaxID=325984 RepID=A0A9D5H5K1_9LILI|nr:hypothetical protein J5N97_029145 [Dioscorea zingiberensis]
MDTGTPIPPPTEPQLQIPDTMTRPPPKVDELGYGSWMIEQKYQIQRGSRGRGRGRGRGFGRGSGSGRGDGHPAARVQTAVDGHVISQLPEALTEPEHVPSSLPVMAPVPNHGQEQDKAPSDARRVESPTRGRPVGRHVQEKDKAPSDVRRVESPPRGRPVGRSSRGSPSRDEGDDRLISFVKKRASRERSLDGFRGGRDRSRSLNRNEGRQDDIQPGRELASRSTQKANPYSGQLDNRDGTRGGNLMITSLDDEDDFDHRPATYNRRGKGKAYALDLNQSSHLGLVRRLSQALEREKPEHQSDEESIEEDDPPDRGRRVVEDRPETKEQSDTSSMEAIYSTDYGQGRSRILLPSDDCCP